MANTNLDVSGRPDIDRDASVAQKGLCLLDLFGGGGRVTTEEGSGGQLGGEKNGDGLVGCQHPLLDKAVGGLGDEGRDALWQSSGLRYGEGRLHLVQLEGTAGKSARTHHVRELHKQTGRSTDKASSSPGTINRAGLPLSG